VKDMAIPGEQSRISLYARMSGARHRWPWMATGQGCVEGGGLVVPAGLLRRSHAIW